MGENGICIFFLKNGGKHYKDEEWAKKNLCNYSSFREFVLSLKKGRHTSKILRWKHFRPQHEYLVDYNGELAVDFVGKVEEIKNDFEHIKEKVNIENELRHRNKSKHDEYKNYYDLESVRVVSNLYSKDINMFGYDFGHEKQVEI
jgi:hypothetical protein